MRNLGSKLRSSAREDLRATAFQMRPMASREAELLRDGEGPGGLELVHNKQIVLRIAVRRWDDAILIVQTCSADGEQDL